MLVTMQNLTTLPIQFEMEKLYVEPKCYKNLAHLDLQTKKSPKQEC